MKVTVRVTEQDIGAGERGACFWCPVAQAATRAIGVACGAGFNAHLGTAYLFFQGDRDTMGVPAPPHVGAWMLRFDAGLEVRPISFDVHVPAPYDQAR